VDFGEVSDDGLLTALHESDVEVGEVVFMFDGDGNSCYAVIDSMDGALVYLRPRWETWSSGVLDTRQVSGSGARFAKVAFSGDSGATAVDSPRIRISYA